jgi:glycerol-3-phosphate acyltransferase PlsY
MLHAAAGLILAYLLGSIPSAYIAVKVLKKIDLRKAGSGNMGASNVYRLAGWKGAVPVIIMDTGKGFLSVVIMRELAGSQPVWEAAAVIAVIAGHMFTLFLGFKGGKGVAAGAGAMGALSPAVVPFCLGLFILILLVTKIVSAASLSAAFSLPFVYAGCAHLGLHSYKFEIQLFMILCTILIFIAHRENIIRLLRGEEKKIARI